MAVIVCGAGRVGYNVIKYLSQASYPVVVIDNDPTVIQKISEDLDVQAILGEASHPEVLEKAGVAQASYIIATTEIDEVNMVICEIAHALFHVKNKIARIRNVAYLNSKYAAIFDPKYLCIDHIISPEVEVAKTIGDCLSVPGAFVVHYLSDGKIKVAGIKCTPFSPIVNTPISRIPNLFPHIHMTVLGISRADEQFIPQDDEVLQENDDVYVCFPNDQKELVMEAFGLVRKSSEKVIILGGGQIGFQLAKHMEDVHENVHIKIIEVNRSRAEFLSQTLEKTSILYGNALDFEVLDEANAGSADIIVSVTEDDKVNALSALVAKQFGTPRVLALINNLTYARLVPTLGIDGVINPRAITVSKILQCMKRPGIRAVYSLRENLGEVLEIDIHENSVFIGRSVADISKKYLVKFGAIIREGVYLNPNPKIVLSLTDIAILIISRDSDENLAFFLTETLGL